MLRVEEKAAPCTIFPFSADESEMQERENSMGLWKFYVMKWRWRFWGGAEWGGRLEVDILLPLITPLKYLYNSTTSAKVSSAALLAGKVKK